MSFKIIIPARGNSKRIPLKNMIALNQKPLLWYTLQYIKKIDLVEHTYISTENDKISDFSKKHNFKVIDRPIALSHDDTSTEEVVIDALNQIVKKGISLPKWCIILPPTSPFRKISTLKSMIELMHKIPSHIDCLMTVTQTKGDYWVEQNSNNNILKRIFPNEPRNQQDRKPIFEENSSIYITKTDILKSTHSILGNITRGVTTEFPETIDINTYQDLLLAELIIKSKEFELDILL